jgi:hypothetical protein
MTKYEIILYWSDEDDAFIAEVPELAGCAPDVLRSLTRAVPFRWEHSLRPLYSAAYLICDTGIIKLPVVAFPGSAARMRKVAKPSLAATTSRNIRPVFRSCA